MDTKPTNAFAAYRAARERLDRQLNQINHLVRVHDERQRQDPRNFGFAGDLGHVADLLNNVIEFLGGTREKIQ